MFFYKYLKSIRKMDARELRNLQEAYMEVVENQRLEEQYQIIIPYLIEEGYANTLEEAEEIFINLDEASKNTLSKAVGKLAWKATKAGAKLAWKGTKAALKAVRDYGGDYPIGSKRRAVSDTIDKVHWASLSDAERRKRTNAKHRARNTKKGHEEIMARNRRSQEVSDRWHEQQRKKQERKRAQTGRYRNKGVGRRENVRESYDIYDIILSYLLDEGYAETSEAAEAIMVNMSEEWRESIVEMGENIGREPKTVGKPERPTALPRETYKQRQERMKPTGPKLKTGQRPSWHR